MIIFIFIALASKVADNRIFLRINRTLSTVGVDVNIVIVLGVNRQLSFVTLMAEIKYFSFKF